MDGRSTGEISRTTRTDFGGAALHRSHNAAVAVQPSTQSSARSYRTLSPFNLAMKRLLDLLLTSAIVLAISPLMLVLWVAIRLGSKGPGILVQKRVGYKGRTFNFYKFRTMYVDVDDSSHREYVKQWMRDESYEHRTAEAGNDQGCKVFKIVNDKRVTPIGRFLRKYSLDELPQFFNVLKLDMSLVGPRPAMVYEVEKYEEEHMQRLYAPPGITGAWQVAGRNRLSFKQMVDLDVQYIQNWSVFTDLRILALTIPAVLRGTGH
jgi:lipopolysaccharide/colanic/teichoic acid biosynthesis glycosyltransferase